MLLWFNSSQMPNQEREKRILELIQVALSMMIIEHVYKNDFIKQIRRARVVMVSNLINN